MYRKVNFVVVNLLSSSILLVRSILFLKYMPDRELGLLMIFQSIIAILGLTQIGLFNGGFRILSIDAEAPIYKTVNDTNITFVTVITVVFISISLLVFTFLKENLIINILAALTGGFALLRNWFSNLLIARQRLSTINILNLTGAIVSVSLAITILKWGITGAILSISAEYLIFVTIFFIIQKEYRLSQFKIKFSVVKKMLAFGFIPYLGGIAIILNNQIDRFFVSEVLSLEALGKFYLATAFISLFYLIPNNLNSLFLAPAINSYSKGKFKDTLRITKIFLVILMAYSLVSWSLLLLFGNAVVSAIFPDKISQLRYLFAMLPGIVAITLSKPFSFLLYVALNLKAILWSNIVSLMSYLFILILLILMSNFTLENVAYGKSLQGILTLFLLVVFTAGNWNRIRNFYYTNRSF